MIYKFLQQLSLLTIVFLVSSLSANQFQKYDTYSKSEILNEMLEENNSLPKYIGNGVTATKITVQYHTLNTNFSVDMKQLSKERGKSISIETMTALGIGRWHMNTVQNYCSNPEKLYLLNRDISFRYILYFNNGEKFGEYKITKHSCQ